MYVSPCWLFNSGTSMWRSSLENEACHENEFVVTSIMPHMTFHLTWRVCEMGGEWWHRCCLVGFCFQDLFKTACSIIYINIYVCVGTSGLAKNGLIPFPICTIFTINARYCHVRNRHIMFNDRTYKEHRNLKIRKPFY